MAEAAIQLAVLHTQQIAQYYSDGVDYIEDMLRKQLIAAIGKEVTPVDFANYMVSEQLQCAAAVADCAATDVP